MNNIKEDLNKQRDIPCSLDRRAQYYQDVNNLSYRVNIKLIKIPTSYFVDIGKLIIKLIWRRKRLRKYNTILKNNKVKELTPSDFESYSKAIVVVLVNEYTS